MDDEPTKTDENHITTAHRNLSELESTVRNHDIVTDHLWGTAIDGEFEDGWLQSETCRIRINVSVAMDEPAWKILAFEETLTKQAEITDRRVKGSFAAPVRYTDTGIPVPANVNPPAEEQKTHTGYYTVEMDITDLMDGM